MKYVFFGGQESPFAEIILKNLEKAGLSPVAAIRDAKMPLEADYLKSFKADFFLVAAFAKILKKEIIEIPEKGTLGVHPSLLPRLRGASPIQSAILNGEKITGTTIFTIDEKVDHGPIVAQRELAILQGEAYSNLLERLAELSSKLCVETLPKWFTDELKPAIQNEALATYTKKFTGEDGKVDLDKDNPTEIWLKIRALNPEPGVFTTLPLKNGKNLRLKLLAAEMDNNRLKPVTVQPEGKKPMAYSDFLNGYQKFTDFSLPK